MIYSNCLCSKTASFIPYISYKNETVFREYEGIVIGKCVACGLLKTFPPHSSNIFNPIITKFKDYEEKREEFEVLFRPIVNAVEEYIPKCGTVLDVGCSSGILLNMLSKEGYSVVGVEPNYDAFKAAHNKLGKKIIHGTIKTLPSKLKFDCIIYNHVLEHVEDIPQEMNSILKRLNANGVLIVGVPNTDNIVFKMRNKYWEYLLPNEHVWHFSARYLMRFIEKKGFNNLEIQFFNDKRNNYPIIKRLYFSLLSLLNTFLNTGEAVLIVVRK